jgi:uncharacterized protein (TIGR03546 family)
MIGLIAKLIVALNSNSRTGEMASAIAFGFLLALIPGGNLLWTLLFIFAFLLKHNMGSFLLSLVVFRLFTPFFDTILNSLGEIILEASFLTDFFTFLYNLPLLSYTNFNNTIVMGAFVAGVLLWFPLFLLFRIFVKVYRKKLAPRIADSKLVKALKKVPLLSKITKAVTKLSVAV